MAIRNIKRDDPILKNRWLTLCSPPDEKIKLLKSNFAPISIIADPNASKAKSVNAMSSDCDISFAMNTPTSDDPVIQISKQFNNLIIVNTDSNLPELEDKLNKIFLNIDTFNKETFIKNYSAGAITSNLDIL